MRRNLAALVLVLIAAFGLRVFQLDAVPLWWDEGLTLTFSRLPLAENIAFAVQTEDVNPPIYRWAVGGLTQVVGTTVFTTRLVNVYAGLLAVAAGIALAKRLFSRRVALIAGWLTAASPMAIYYAQEAKGYAFVSAALLIGALVWWWLHRWLFDHEAPHPHPATYAVMIPVVLCAMGANYLALFGLVTLNLYSLIVSWRSQASRSAIARHWGLWLSVQAIGVSLLLPFVLGTLGGTSAGLDSTSTEQIVYGPLGHTVRVMTTLAAGVGASGGWAVLVTLLLLGLALLGSIWTADGKATAAVWGWVLIPLVLGFFFQLRFPWFFPRFLLFTQAGLATLAAMGIARLAERTHQAGAIIGAVVVVGLHLPLLAPVYAAEPTFAEDPDWPPLYAALEQFQCEDDLVLMSLPWMPGYMYAYTDDPAAWRLAFFDDDDMDAALAPLVDDHDRIWQIDYGVDPLVTPTNTLSWMQGRAAVPYTQSFGTGHLTLYMLPSEAAPTQQATFANGLTLRWAALDGTYTAGDAVTVNMGWQAEGPTEGAYVRFLHVMAPDGRLLAQTDRQPVLGQRPTYSWPPNAVIDDPVGVMLPVDLPAGRYTLWVGLYDRDTFERVSVAGSDHVVVGTLTVED